MFEHQQLRINDTVQGVCFEKQHWEALLRLQEKQYQPFYKIVHQGVQFTSYVGLLVLPSLVIEILPKTDEYVDTPGIWRNWLLEMLLACEKIPPCAAPANPLQTHAYSLHDFWLHQFLAEVETLLQMGLMKKYQVTEGPLPSLRGTLLFSKNIRQRLVHQEKFYTRHMTYDALHYFHRIIGKALDQVAREASRAALREKARSLQTYFPHAAEYEAVQTVRKKIRYDRQSRRYQPAMELAHLILSYLSPLLKTGEHTGRALLFDMNQLYEVFVYKQLHKAALKKNLPLHKQVSTPFWARSSLRPDMVLYTAGGEKIILDTKWKLLFSNQPADEDLKQIYIYNHYFQAKRGILLYPKVTSQVSFRKAFLQPTDQTLYCEVLFVEVLNKQQRLNTALGDQLLEQVAGL